MIRREYVFLGVDAKTKDEAIHQVAQLAKGHPHIGDFPSFCRAIYERESSGTTSIGHGVALPHARTEQVKDMLVVVARLTQGVQFEPADDAPVRLVILLGTPKKMVTEYLRLVGMLARHLKNDEVRAKLMNAPDAESFIRVFRDGEEGVG